MRSLGFEGLKEHPWEEENRKTEGDREDTSYFVSLKRNEMLSENR